MDQNLTKTRPRRFLPILCCAGLVLAAAVALLLSRYLWAGGRFLPRDAEQLDLRGSTLSLEEYSRIRKKLPECDILWDVPFQGSRYPSDTRTLAVTQLMPEDVALLDLFPDLTLLDARTCNDYAALLDFQSRRPDCQVRYQVTLCGKTYPQDAVTLELQDPSVEELTEKLPYLPQVTQVLLTGTLPDSARLTALREAFPDIDIQWQVSFGGRVFHSADEAVDLSGSSLTLAEAEALPDLLPSLKTVTLRDCGLTDEEMMTLADRHPGCFFLWDMTIGTVKIPTDAEEIDITGQHMDSPEQIESLLPYFPNVKKIIMSHCGLDDETMDALNKRHDDIRFIWSVKISFAYIRTDATFFYPFTIKRDMIVDNDDLYPLRYCTDMIAIDIGHMTTVKNCEWAAFMPNLKYLIIAETAISDLTPLSGLKNLVHLEMFTVPVTDYSPLLGCTALEDLNLGNTYGDPTPIAQMTWLKNLWWSGIAGTVGHPCSDAHTWLPQALPNTRMKFHLSTPNANNGWRQLENYYAMRDLMGVFYLT